MAKPVICLVMLFVVFFVVHGSFEPTRMPDALTSERTDDTNIVQMHLGKTPQLNLPQPAGLHPKSATEKLDEFSNTMLECIKNTTMPASDTHMKSHLDALYTFEIEEKAVELGLLGKQSEGYVMAENSAKQAAAYVVKHALQEGMSDLSSGSLSDRVVDVFVGVLENSAKSCGHADGEKLAEIEKAILKTNSNDSSGDSAGIAKNMEFVIPEKIWESCVTQDMDFDFFYAESKLLSHAAECFTGVGVALEQQSNVERRIMNYHMKQVLVLHNASNGLGHIMAKHWRRHGIATHKFAPLNVAKQMNRHLASAAVSPLSKRQGAQLKYLEAQHNHHIGFSKSEFCKRSKLREFGHALRGYRDCHCEGGQPELVCRTRYSSEVKAVTDRATLLQGRLHDELQGQSSSNDSVGMFLPCPAPFSCKICIKGTCLTLSANPNPFGALVGGTDYGDSAGLITGAACLSGQCTFKFTLAPLSCLMLHFKATLGFQIEDCTSGVGLLASFKVWFSFQVCLGEAFEGFQNDFGLAECIGEVKLEWWPHLGKISVTLLIQPLAAVEIKLTIDWPVTDLSPVYTTFIENVGSSPMDRDVPKTVCGPAARSALLQSLPAPPGASETKRKHLTELNHRHQQQQHHHHHSHHNHSSGLASASDKTITGDITIKQPEEEGGWYDAREYTQSACDFLYSGPGGLPNKRSGLGCWTLNDLTCSSGEKCLKWGGDCYAGRIVVPEGMSVELIQLTGTWEDACSDSRTRVEGINGIPGGKYSGPGETNFWEWNNRACAFKFEQLDGYSCPLKEGSIYKPHYSGGFGRTSGTAASTDACQAYFRGKNENERRKNYFKAEALALRGTAQLSFVCSYSLFMWSGVLFKYDYPPVALEGLRAPKPVMKLRSQGNCLDTDKGTANVFMKTCHSGNSQKWYWELTAQDDMTTEGRFRSVLDRNCLDYNVQNDNVGTWDCNGQDNQLWKSEDGDMISKVTSDKCEGGKCCAGISSGSNVEMQKCQPGLSLQRWTNEVTGAEIHVESDWNRCLQYSNQKHDVFISSCDNGAYQKWRFRGDGQLTTDLQDGQCLTYQLSDPNTLFMSTCSEAVAQLWYFKGDQLRSEVDARCVDNGKVVGMWDCNGQTNQQWWYGANFP